MDRQEYLDLINPALVLVVKKHQDYQSGGTKLGDYFPFGGPSYVQMLHVKTMRLVSLTAADQPPANESVKDTVLDLINYAVFYLAFLEQQNAERV